MKRNSRRDNREYDSDHSSQSNSTGRSERAPSRKRQRKKVKFILAKKKSDSIADDVGSSDDENTKYIPVGYKYLKEMSEKKAHEVVVEILNKDSRFEVFLSQSEVAPDWLFMVVKILASVCLSSFVGAKSEMLSKICRSKLIHSISFYLGEIQMETNATTITNFKPFITDLTAFLESVVFTVPKMSYEKGLKKIITKTVRAVEEMNTKFKSCIEETIVQRLNTLIDKIDNYQEVVEGNVSSSILLHY